jgi:hypothetical protein
MHEFPLLRLLKIQAAITYLEFVKKSRKVFLYFVSAVAALFLMCVGIILIALSFLLNINSGVFLFGIAIILISSVVMGFLFSEKAWMSIFEVHQLIEDIEKGGVK